MLRRVVVLCYKQTVQSSFELGRDPTEKRFWTVLAGNYACQLTSYSTGEQFEEAPMVSSVLAAAAVDEDASGHRDIYFTTKKDSKDEKNLRDGSMLSLMWGSTNPQVHHFFKQLNAKCWTATVTGRAEEVRAEDGALLLFTRLFRQNPFLLNLAHRTSRPKTPLQIQRKAAKVTQEDEDDEGEDPVVTPEGLTVWRLSQENGFLGRPDGGLDKVPVLTIPPLDPLGHLVQQWISRMNFRRDILIEGIRTAYSQPVVNAFVFHLDSRGMYCMGQQETDPTWREFFLEWGPDMVFDDPRQLRSWWEEFVDQAQVSFDNVTVEKPRDLTR